MRFIPTSSIGQSETDGLETLKSPLILYKFSTIFRWQRTKEIFVGLGRTDISVYITPVTQFTHQIIVFFVLNEGIPQGIIFYHSSQGRRRITEYHIIADKGIVGLVELTEPFPQKHIEKTFQAEITDCMSVIIDIPETHRGLPPDLFRQISQLFSQIDIFGPDGQYQVIQPVFLIDCRFDNRYFIPHPRSE